jgi:hypothetical protein
MTAPTAPGGSDTPLLPPFLATIIAAGGEVATTTLGTDLGTTVKTALVAVIGLAYAVFIREHHATVRASTNAAGAIAAAKVAATPRPEAIASAVASALPGILASIMPAAPAPFPSQAGPGSPAPSPAAVVPPVPGPAAAGPAAAVPPAPGV